MQLMGWDTLIARVKGSRSLDQQTLLLLYEFMTQACTLLRFVTSEQSNLNFFVLSNLRKCIVSFSIKHKNLAGSSFSEHHFRLPVCTYEIVFSPVNLALCQCYYWSIRKNSKPRQPIANITVWYTWKLVLEGSHDKYSYHNKIKHTHIHTHTRAKQKAKIMYCYKLLN